MKCTECEHENIRSKVYHKFSTQTSMGGMQYYDENGKFHDHDPNCIVSHFECDNGHTFTKSKYNSCWCGWPNIKE